MGRSCLVLGGKGFVGSAIVRAAARHGWDAVPAGKSDLAGLAGRSWDLVINANGNSKKYLSDRDPNLDFDLSVQSVAHSLTNFPTPRYVFLSTVDVYPDKSDPANNTEDSVIDPARLSRYGFHKWLAEQLVRFGAKDWLILRMAGFVGAGLKKNPIYDLLTGGTLRVHPDSAYQYQDSDALADRIFSLVAKGVNRTIINAAGDGLITPRDVAAMIPGARLPAEAESLPRERYEISIERMKSYCPVEPSRDAVAAFVHRVRTGEVRLS